MFSFNVCVYWAYMEWLGWERLGGWICYIPQFAVWYSYSWDWDWGWEWDLAGDDVYVRGRGEGRAAWVGAKENLGCR